MSSFKFILDMKAFYLKYLIVFNRGTLPTVNNLKEIGLPLSIYRWVEASESWRMGRIVPDVFYGIRIWDKNIKNMG